RSGAVAIRTARPVRMNKVRPTPNATDVEEIVVTAQKREERLKDVPVPVSVINTQVLSENNQVLIRDYYTSVPGLYLLTDVVTEQTLYIRGLPAGGIVVDDIPFSATTSYLGSEYMPDIDPGDLDRIEVLRGPQGTLYGANSMGGLIKYVTKEPSPDAYSG